MKRTVPCPAIAPVCLVVLALIAAPSARAEVITFDFNSLSKGAGSSAITSHMNGLLPSGSHVSVSHATVRTDYTGDNHVVGPVVGGMVKPVTLGTSDGGVLHSGSDSFLTNSGSDRITMTFDFPIYAVSFDFQIFPDGTMPDGTKHTPNHSSWPDFSFRADGELIFREVGVMPGTAGTHPHSPFSGLSKWELAPQLIGTSGLIQFPNGVKKLEFVDWPRMIGIDNLHISTSPQTAVPEPGMLALFSVGMGALAVARYRRRRSAN